MLNNRNREFAGFLFSLLIILVLSSCAGDKKTVNPYRDRSYTTSVAHMPPRNESQAADLDNTLQEKTVVNPIVRPQTQSPKEISSGEVLSLLTLVDDRIVEYEGKSELWKKFIAEASTITLDEERQDKIVGCQSTLMHILTGYNQLHQRLIRESNGSITDASVIEGFLATERQDISFLESDCQQIVMADQQGGGWIAGTRERLLEEKERELKDKMASGEYAQVIELYTLLPLDKGQHPSYLTSYNYGQALLRSGREKDAAIVFRDLLASLREQNQIEREFKLMQLIADIQFGLENYNKAFERYVDIINRYAGLGENIDWARKQQSVISVRNARGIEVRNFAELMRGYLTYNPERDAFKVSLLASRFLDNFPESSVQPTVNHILSESADWAEAWFALVMQRISVLKEEKKYQEALQVISRLPMNEMPEDKKELLHSLNDEMITASFNEEESRRLADEKAMQEIWSKGQNFLRSKEYDQAIEVFSTLLNTTYSERANDKIVEASRLAAQEGRRKAAELFVLAGKTNDQNNRVALLFQSRQLLKDILKKYRQSGLVEKAQKNLERIEEEIRKIDPSLLTETEVTEDKQENFQQPAETKANIIPIREWKEKEETGFPQQ